MTAGLESRVNGGPQSSALATQAGALSQAGQVSALLPRLLTVPMAATYLSLSVDVIAELLEAGTFARVTVPAPVTAKRRGGAIRRVLLDRLQLDAKISAWSQAAVGEGGR